MSGCSRWNASIRGSSQSEPNEAKVVTLTRRRLRERRICWTLLSSLASQGSTARSSVWPSGEICTWRVPRTKSGAPSSSSRPLIWRLIADCVRCSSSAAAPKLSSRATASKARRLVSESGRREWIFMRYSASIDASGFIGFPL